MNLLSFLFATFYVAVAESRTKIPRFRIAYDEKTWWTCHFKALDCMSELLRKITHLVTIPECSNRVYYLANTGTQLRDVQYAARLLEEKRTISNSDRLYMSPDGGNHSGKFSPVMEVLANVALQKAQVCFVDGFAIHELIAYIDGRVACKSQNISAGELFGANATLSSGVGAAGLQVSTNSPTYQAANSDPLQLNNQANNPLSINSQLAANNPQAAQNPAQQEAAQEQPSLSSNDSSCKLPADTANMIRQRVADLSKSKARIDVELADFREVVDGYEKMGSGTTSASQNSNYDDDEEDRYSNQQSSRISAGLTNQFKRLAMDIRRKIGEYESLTKDSENRMNEYQNILQSAGCPSNNTMQTSQGVSNPSGTQQFDNTNNGNNMAPQLNRNQYGGQMNGLQQYN